MNNNTLLNYLSPRRPWLWLIVVLTVYTLAGFFLAPWYIKKIEIAEAKERFDRTATLARVSVNPFLLTLSLEENALLDPDGTVVLSYDRYFMNFQLSSLFNWAWTFSEVQVEGLVINEERFGPNDSRLGRLIKAGRAHAEALRSPEEKADQEDRSPIRLIVHDLQLINGKINFTDHLRDDDFQAELHPINISVANLNTLPNESGQQQVTLRNEKGASISWAGSLQFAPLKSVGKFNIEGKGLSELHRYVDLLFPFTTSGEGVSIALNYDVSAQDDGSFSIDVSDLSVDARGFKVELPGEGKPVVEVQAIALDGGSFSWPGKEISVSSVNVESPVVRGWRSADHTLSFEQLKPDKNGTQSTATANSNPQSSSDSLNEWLISIQKSTVNNATLDFQDRALADEPALVLESVNIEAGILSNQPTNTTPLKGSFRLQTGGELAFEGSAEVLPEFKFDSDIDISELELPVIQPWLSQFALIKLESGKLNLQGNVSSNPGNAASFGGSLNVNNFSVTDLGREEDLVGWTVLDIDRAEFSLEPREVSLSELNFKEPFGRVRIAEDLTTNIGDLMIKDTVIKDEDGVSGTQADPTAPMAVNIGGVSVLDGRLEFTDLSLPLPFSASIRNLEGEISTLSTTSSEPSNVSLEGQVNEYGQAKIEGQINAWAFDEETDIQVDFRNLEMARLTPYTIQFAGREIADGRLDLDLDYQIQQRQLVGGNQIVIRNLTLGDEVDHPDAVSLPLGLAVALLTDSEGVIDIDLPISGDMNDPEFKIGGIVAKAIFNLITKLVTAPFRLLGNLVGMDSEDFGTLAFDAGESELSPPDREKLLKLGEAMRLRPELTLTVGRVYDSEVDAAAISRQTVENMIDARMDLEQIKSEELSTTIERKVVESMFLEAFPEVELGMMQGAFMSPIASIESSDQDAETIVPVLDEPAYVADLRQRLVQVQIVGEDRLVQLAELRAAAVVSEMSSDESGLIKIQLGEIMSVTSAEAGQVPLELSVETGVRSSTDENL